MDDKTPEAQKLLHLAVTVGYIRLTLAAGSGTHTFGSASRFAMGHLALPAFAAMTEAARGRAEFEIFEYAKDGLLNGADRKIAAAQSGDYAMFWDFADRALEGKAERSEIAPDMIA